jgi:hypothetical protein
MRLKVRHRRPHVKQRLCFHGFARVPTNIVPQRNPDGHWIRVIRWQHAGMNYSLGYNPDRLFGERLRSIRRALLLSMQFTIEQATGSHQLYVDEVNAMFEGRGQTRH